MTFGVKDKIQGIFAEVVKLLLSVGYVSLEVQYIDGTKIEASAKCYTFVWRKRVNVLSSPVKSVLYLGCATKATEA
jgi:transposase